MYSRARELANGIYQVTREGRFSKDYGLVDQIRRASVSVMSNIAEGFERGSNAEFVEFLFIAKGSCGEVRAQLAVALDQGYVDESSYPSLVDRCRQVSGMLGNLIHHLKASAYRGTLYKKPPVKSMAEEVDEMLRKIQERDP